MSASGSDDGHVLTKRGERRVFLFITVFLFPILSLINLGKPPPKAVVYLN